MPADESAIERLSWASHLSTEFMTRNYGHEARRDIRGSCGGSFQYL